MKLLLQTNELLDLGRSMNDLLIICDDGCCWITQSGDHQDHILKAGEIYHVKSNGQLIITALIPCHLVLKVPCRKKTFHNLFKSDKNRLTETISAMA